MLNYLTLKINNSEVELDVRNYNKARVDRIGWFGVLIYLMILIWAVVSVLIDKT